MSILNNSLLLGQEGGGGYAISRSLRFNSSDSAYLSRTPASAGNRTTWTWAGWVKRSALSSPQTLFSAYIGSGTVNNEFFSLTFTNDRIEASGYSTKIFSTSAVYRDFSAWYHVVLALGTTNATSSDRVKLWVNGSLVTAFQSTNYPSLNEDLAVNLASLHAIGKWSGFTGAELSAYLADIHFCDGTAYDASAFGEFDANGIWQPKKFAGVYGSQGWHLDFSDNSAATATTLGKDSSGNGNNWTPNNLSVTAGAGNDSLVDVPTNGSEVDTGSGGQVRGNYCTWNPVARLEEINFNLTNGNLDFSQSASNNAISYATFALDSGKWYWEVVHTALANSSYDTATYIATDARLSQTASPRTKGVAYLSSGNKKVNDTNTSYGSSYTTGDVIGIALDADSNSVTYYKNGVSQGAISLTYISGYCPAVLQVNGSLILTGSANFGQRPFAYPVSGFKALNTSSLPAPVITKPSTVFDVKLYTGNGSTQTISGLGFSPDLVWLKVRSAAVGHGLFDQVRGAGKALYSHATIAEYDYGTTTSGELYQFNSDGFNLGSFGVWNVSSQTSAAWCWDAGNTTVTNTQGSITSSVRANATAGFSICTFTSPTGTGNFSVGHGLGVTPEMVIVKSRDAVGVWYVYHKSLATDYYLRLNGTNAAATDGVQWGAGMTSTVLGFRAGYSTVGGATTVAYAFAPVVGYSSFGSYTGNGSTDGPFIYTGFRPRFVIQKQISAGTAGEWVMWDSSRKTYNSQGPFLLANFSSAEGSDAEYVDFLSNGFKFRSSNTTINGSGVTSIYIAFAESPFQYARAR